MQTRLGLLWLAVIASGLLGNAAAQAQTSVVVDPGLGTQVSSIQTDPGQPDNIIAPNLGDALLTVGPSRTRALLGDFGNAAQGTVGVTPVSVAYSNGLLGLGNTIHVIDYNAGTNDMGALFAIDPTTGNRTLLSDFGNSAQGALVVLDDDAGTGGVGKVVVVDCATATALGSVIWATRRRVRWRLGRRPSR
jgi:hypothetical protein